MKKITKVLASAALMAMTLTFAACGKYATMEEYVQSDEVQKELDSVMDQLEGSGMQMEVYGDGDKLVYAYTYTEEIDAELAAPLLESALLEQGDQFESVADALKKEVDVENPIVVVTYLNADGSEIYSAEFTAE